MPTLYILPHPGENAVFFEASETLALAELSLCAQTLGAADGSVRAETLAGLRYYALDLPAKPDETALLRLSRLSSAYALYEKQNDLLPFAIPFLPLFFPFSALLSAKQLVPQP